MKRSLRTIGMIIFAAALTALFLFVLSPAASAEEITGSFGADGNNLTWVYDTNKWHLKISGSGDMEDFTTAEKQPWREYRNSIASVYIEEGVTSIGESSFSYLKQVQKVTIPKSVKEIRHGAFSHCEILEDITIPEGVEILYNDAFSSCSRLGAVTLPSSLRTIKGSPFVGCYLTSIRFSKNNENYYSVRSPDGLYLIENSSKTLIYGNGQGSSGMLTLPKEVLRIGSMAFANNDRINAVILPPELKIIGTMAFYDCSNLLSVELGQKVTGINPVAFGRCTSLTVINLPVSVTSIGDNAFDQCHKLKEVIYCGTDGQLAGIKMGANVTFGAVFHSYHYKEDTSNYHVAVCNYCGINEFQGHDFNREIINDRYLARLASNCLESDEYYYSCVCGLADISTFLADTSSEHSFSDERQYNETQHWKVCEVCGLNDEIKKHILGKWKLNEKTGERQRDCAICEYFEIEESEPTETDTPETLPDTEKETEWVTENEDDKPTEVYPDIPEEPSENDQAHLSPETAKRVEGAMSGALIFIMLGVVVFAGVAIKLGI